VRRVLLLVVVAALMVALTAPVASAAKPVAFCYSTGTSGVCKPTAKECHEAQASDQFARSRCEPLFAP
jgi:hypothetical protein